MRTIAFALAALCACGNSSTYTPFISSAGVGSVSSAFSVPAGATSLDISGAFFDHGMKVFWNGAPQTTHFVSSTQASVDLAPGLTAAPGTAQLTAQNDGGFVSAPLTVSVFERFMTVTSVSPQQLALGGADSTITVTGTSFLQSDVVLWNGVKLTTALVNGTTLTATVPAALLTSPSDGFIGVSDPACPGGNLCLQSVAGPVVQVGASIRGTLGGDVADAAWDATDAELLLLSFDDSVVTARTPAGAFVRSSLSDTSNERRRLAVSDGDHFVYLFTAAFTSPQETATPLRLPLPGLQAGVTLTGFPAVGGPGTLAPAPGAATTVAVVSGGAAIIVDETTARAKTADATGVVSLAWGPDGSTLYGIAPFTQNPLVRFDVDGTGITAKTALGMVPAQFEDFVDDGTTRRLYGDSGWNVDEQGGDPRPFAVTGPRRNNCVASIDATLGKAFFACRDQDFGITVQSFDLATQQLIGNILMRTASGFDTPSRLLRFGTDGLAVVAGGLLSTYQGPFVH